MRTLLGTTTAVLAAVAFCFIACGDASPSGDGLFSAAGSSGSTGASGSESSTGGAGSGLAMITRSDAQVPGSGGAGGSTVAGGGGTGGGAGGSVTTDAGMPTDASPPADACSVVDASVNLQRDPAVNACGESTCEYKTSYCCAPRGNDKPACVSSPYGSDKSVCQNQGRIPITCDEKAKCQHSTVCCGRMGDASVLAVVTCVEKVDCQAPDLVICGSDADCYVGQHCAKRTFYGETLGVCEMTN